MVRHSSNASELWKALPWKEYRKTLFRLQKRIFKAVEAGNMQKARSLQRLVLKSKAARMLAIRQVTQLNQGRKTAGVDGKKSLNFDERYALEARLSKHAENWEHQGLRSIPIPKSDGSTRILKVPTIADRAWQCLVKYALEPAHEATFHAKSYGFRSGRGAHDAQKVVFNNLNSRAKGYQKRIIELDIEKCFDRISHKAIMDRLIAPKGIKTGIFRCLKSGVNPEFPEQGTPQGGVVSPLLANIALNGIESIHRYHKDGCRITNKTKAKDIIEPSIRYADDMVIFLRPEDNADEILDKINKFLASRGMNISAKKTKITASTDGFDFLGWHFEVQKSNQKFRCTPSKDNYQEFKAKVKNIVNCSNYGADVKAKKLAPIVRGWRNYHKYCDMSQHNLWFLNKRTWEVFNKQKSLNKDQVDELVKKAFPSVSVTENGHVGVEGRKSPFDGDVTYWTKRESKYYFGETAEAIKRQKHKCGICGLEFMPGEKVHLHHIDGNHDNWKKKNLLAVHESCHNYIHTGKSAS